MKPIFSKESVEVFNKLGDILSDEQKDSIVGFGSDMYSCGLVRGSMVAFCFAAIPVVAFELNRLLREHP